eukprot:30271-Eustigmatos_ZCMA.PRE.1
MRRLFFCSSSRVRGRSSSSTPDSSPELKSSDAGGATCGLGGEETGLSASPRGSPTLLSTPLPAWLAAYICRISMVRCSMMP